MEIKKCPQCGLHNDDSVTQRERCGHSFTPEAPTPNTSHQQSQQTSTPATTIYCRTCGKENLADAVTCVWCSARLAIPPQSQYAPPSLGVSSGLAAPLF